MPSFEWILNEENYILGELLEDETAQRELSTGWKVISCAFYPASKSAPQLYDLALAEVSNIHV